MASTTRQFRAFTRAPAAKPLLVVDDIVMNFDTPEGVLTAVDHISLDVAPGEFLP